MTTPTRRYKHYPERPSRLTADFVGEEYGKLHRRIASAEVSRSAEAWLELYQDWNALKSYVRSEARRARYALSRRMDDETLEEADRRHREEIAPLAAKGSFTMIEALLGSRHKEAVAGRYGAHLLPRLERLAGPLAPINSDFRVEESALVHRYDKLVASGEVALDGERVTLAVARSRQSSEDRSIRRQALEAYRTWFLEHRDELAGIFDELVKLRHRMARNLGHESFVPLAYSAMGRTDYGPAEVAGFRESIRRHAVPLLREIYRLHAREAGAGTLKPWDALHHSSLTLPLGVVPVETQLAKAQRVFDALSPRLGNHFARMREQGLIDLENRKGKMAGAYCVEFSDEGCVAIFCNSTGDAEDVRTLMHEMGHAFQGWESQPIEAVELQAPTAEVGEIHSKAMEYLSLRFMGEFFQPRHAAKFRHAQWVRAVYNCCYTAVVDEFQHWVYANPDASPDERDRSWSAIWDRYQPEIDFTGIEPYKVAVWYSQLHIFRYPFYYIDYQIAETAAMQLALLDLEDHGRALETYMELCRQGGTRGALDTFKAAGLRSAFEPELVRDVMALAARELEQRRPGGDSSGGLD